jgi:lysophospholipase L1-like esterase
MRVFSRVAVLVATLLIALLAAAPAMAAKPVYLALGDSWAFGFGATVPSEGGYVPLLHQALQSEFDCSPSDNPKPDQACRQLELNNIAVGGATTPTMIANQFPIALPLLEELNSNQNPRDNVEVITVSIGGNDVVNPIILACLGGLVPSCVSTIESEFAAYRADLDQALSALREAAGPDTRIVLNTYDNGVGQCFLTQINPAAPLLGDIVLENQPAVIPSGQGLHDIMRDVAADYDVEIAEVYGDLGPADWVGGSDCLHPDDSGYVKVAAAFAEVLQN